MLILILILMPLLGSIFLFTSQCNKAKYIALGISLAELLLTLLLWNRFEAREINNYQFQLIPSGYSFVNTSIHFNIDGLGLLMLLLTNILTPIIVYSSLRDKRNSTFYALISLMQFGLVGIFSIQDGLLFYIFWEITLIPIWFICGLYGVGENKYYINLKFFVYTFVGSLFMLIALIYVYLQAGSFDLKTLYQASLNPKEQNLIFWMLFFAFAIKLPIFPFHTWQADTYSMAPTQGSMLLSGIMLKMGIIGIIRLLLPLTPLALSGISGSIALILSIIGIIYASLIAVVQTDLKKLIAFSSMAHVGLIAAGIFSAAIVSLKCGEDSTGIEGASIQMLAHGINVVGMFYAADILIKIYGTKDLTKMGGLALKMPIFGSLFMIISMGTMAVPLTNAFVGEFLLLKSIFTLSIFGAILAGLTLIFSAVYITKVYGISMFGSLKTVNTEICIKDISLQNKIGLAIIAILILIGGIYPEPFLRLSSEAARYITNLMIRNLI